MSYFWFFKSASPGDRARESQVEKFFSSDAVANRSNAIVREGIQNSLDAAPDETLVRVRIALGLWSIDKTEKHLGVYESGFRDHLNADGVKSRIVNVPNSDEPFRYLVFEDFGTTGLHGDPSQWWPDEHGKSDPFFNYFRAEGISGKSEGARGRHGVGRLVFMFASRVRSMYGLTRRSSNAGSEELLMGTSVLRSHRLNEIPYLPDAWFGVPDSGIDGLTLPIRDEAYIAMFKKDFSVSRNDENGLSVIVPWLNKDVTYSEVLKAVLSGYYYPILSGKLVVEVVDEQNQIQLVDAAGIEKIISQQDDEFVSRIAPIVSLAKASLSSSETISILSPTGGSAPRWDATLLPENLASAIHQKLEMGELVSILVPMQVRPKDKPVLDSHFKVFIQRDQMVSDGQIQFIREGIIISDVRPRRTSGIRALVVVEDGALASFLGDSENPSHTEWQKDMVKDKYVYAPAHIDYVIQSVPSMLAILSQLQKKPDTSLLIDLFSIQSDEGPKTKQKDHKPVTGTETKPPKIDIPKKPRRFVIEKRKDGFVVRRGEEGAIRPSVLLIKFAYDIRRGNPFAKYNLSDFQIGLDGIKLETSGCDVFQKGGNWVVVRVSEDDFDISVTGFDTNHRDLHVDVKIRGEDSSELASQQGEAHVATA